MSTHPARRLWATLETLHDVTYFAPEVRSTGMAQGLKGFWMTYFAWRAAPLGPVPAAPVVAMFAGFHPGTVARALPGGVVAHHAAGVPGGAHRGQRRRTAGRGSGPGGLRAGGRGAGPVAAAADPTGRPLGAANAALELPGDPLGRLWQLTTTLREHRGDGHVAALVTEGITGLQAHLLQSASGHIPQAVLQRARSGWTDEDWAGAADALRARGLLTAGPGSRSPRPAARCWTRSRRAPTSGPGAAGWRRSASMASRRCSPCSGPRCARWPRPGCCPRSARPACPSAVSPRPAGRPHQAVVSRTDSRTRRTVISTSPVTKTR